MMCKHESVTGYMWRETSKQMAAAGITGQWAHAFVQPGRVDHHHRVTCDSCGHWLPLGPSTDDERTRIELRAARLAHGENNEHEFTQVEWCGWSGDEIAIDGSTREEVDVTAERGWDAGYLAAVIADLGHAEG